MRRVGLFGYDHQRAVVGDEMTGHARGPRRAPGLDGAEQALFCAMS
jgi:hypothetical protein